MKSIIISVINDLATDQRVHRMAGTLIRLGYRVQLVGRKLPGSLPVSPLDSLGAAATVDPVDPVDPVVTTDPVDPDDADTKVGSAVPVSTEVEAEQWHEAIPGMFRVRRFRMLFKKGPLFYAFYNLRLFFFLLFRRRPAMLVSVDLDTLAASYLVSHLRGIPLLYDSHEYFTEVPELVDRPRVKRTWERIEGMIVPKLTAGIAVSDSIAAVYREKYGVGFMTIRNVPVARKPGAFPELHDTYPSAYKLIYQGALNRGRGIELMIGAMRYIPDALLFVVGDGDIRMALQRLVHSLKLTDRVVFPGRIPPGRLAGLTALCDLGLSLEEDLGLNYRMALPNKIFDYIQARVPVICSDLPEMAGLVERYGVGEVCRGRLPLELAGQVRGILKNGEKRDRWKQQLEIAATELCWEREEQKLVALVDELLGKG